MKLWTAIWPITCVCGFGAYLLVTGSTSVVAQTGNSNLINSITAEKVRPHVVRLADDRLEGRGAGYTGERKAAEYIAAEFKKIGLKPVAGDGVKKSYFQGFKFYPSHPVTPWELMTSRNVIGFIEGNDASLKNEVVVVGAHYDGQGRVGQADPGRYGIDPSKPSTDEIWNSADDNAASIAAILEIARAIVDGRIATKRSILFIAFGAEEHGMSGSMYYVGHPVFSLANHVAMINLEKLGRAPDKPFSVNAIMSSAAWKDVLATAEGQTKTAVVPNIPFNVPDSDHYPFNASRVPAVMFYVSGVSDAHLSSDTADKVDYGRVAEAARFAAAMLLDLATRDTRIEFAPSPIPDMGLSAHLATAAESDAKGLTAPDGGLKVTGVVARLPAALAGLQPGDFIIEFAGYKFRRDDQVAALMSMYNDILQGKRGNVLPLKIIRDKKQMDLTVTLGR